MSCAKGSAANMQIQSNGLSVVKHFEGWFPRCYKDPVGIWTIGYGHACHVNSNDGSGCLSGNNCDTSVTLTEAQGEAILLSDMRTFGNCVRDAVTVPITQNQFDALTSFTFNVGCAGLRDSTLLRMLNAGTLTPLEAQKQFTRWTMGDGTCYSGLQRRRFIEADLFNSCAAPGSFPCGMRSCSRSEDFLKCQGGCSYCDRAGCLSCTGNSATASPTPSTPVAAPTRSPTRRTVNPPTIPSTCDKMEEKFAKLEDTLDVNYLVSVRKAIGTGGKARIVFRKSYPGVDDVIVRTKMPEIAQQSFSDAAPLLVVPEYSASSLESPAWVQMIMDFPREMGESGNLEEGDSSNSASATVGIVLAVLAFVVLGVVYKRRRSTSGSPKTITPSSSSPAAPTYFGRISSRFPSMLTSSKPSPQLYPHHVGNFGGYQAQSHNPSYHHNNL